MRNSLYDSLRHTTSDKVGRVAIGIIGVAILTFSTIIGTATALPSYTTPGNPGCSGCHESRDSQPLVADVSPNSVEPGDAFNVSISLKDTQSSVTGAKIDLPIGFSTPTALQGPSLLSNYAWSVTASDAVAPGNYWIYIYATFGSPKDGYFMPFVTSIKVNGPSNNPLYISNVYTNPQFLTSNETVEILARVFDADHTIQSVALHYRYQDVELVESMAYVAPNRYSATIGPFTNNTFVEYWTVAHDDAGYSIKSNDKGFMVGASQTQPDEIPLFVALLSADIACGAALVWHTKRAKKEDN